MTALKNLIDSIKSNFHVVVLLLFAALLLTRGCQLQYQTVNLGDEVGCIVPPLEIPKTPEIPLRDIQNSAGDYKKKSLVLTEYVENLRNHISDVKKDFRTYKDLVEQNCSK